MNPRDFFTELKRRNVYKVAVAYAVVGWLLIQIATSTFPVLEIPNWATKLVVVVVLLGFPIALIIAWAFEMTPQGIKRTENVSPDEVIPQWSRRKFALFIASVAIVAAGLLLYEFMRPKMVADRPAVDKSARASSAFPDQSIAVLPFVNMSADKEQDYFSDGLSEELLNQLAQIPQLRVIARTSSFSFKGKEVDVATIAKALNVANVLEGSVRKSANTLRITAQLVRASDSSHLWSQTYDREMTDVFKVQDEIANTVVAVLKVKLLPNQALTNQHRSSNTEAYNQLLLGNQLSDRGNPENWRRAMAAFQQAITLDPNYAAAYAGMAGAEAALADSAGDAAAMEQALDAAGKAITLAPDLVYGYVVRGTLRLVFKRNLAGAQADFDKALSLNSGDSTVQLGYSRLMIALGRLPEAIAATRKAIELDPLSTSGWAQLGRLLAASGQFAAAREALNRSLEISPESNYAHFHLGETDLLEGKAQDALAEFRQAGVYGPAGVAMAEHTLGHASESEQSLDEQITKYGHAAAYQVAEVYAWRGEKDKAFEWLDRAHAQNDGGLSFFKVDPLIANLRGDPRFAALAKKMG